MAISKGQKNDGTKEEKVSLEEKIESLVEWRKKYPRATIVPGVSRDVFESYAETEEKQNQLFEEYEKMREYYKYITIRKSQGKLNEEQIERCREGKIGGVFGRDTKTAELIKKYDLREKEVDFITAHYGNIDEFRKCYIDAVSNQDFSRLRYGSIENLISEFDLNSPDWVSRESKNNRLGDIINDLPGRRNTFVKREELEKKVIETIKEKGYSEQEQEILFMWYGINGMEKADEKKIAEKTGKYPARIYRIVEKSMKEFKTPEFLEQLDSENITFDIDLDLQKEIIEEYFKKFDIFVPREPISMDEDVKAKLDTMLLDGVEETKKRKEQENNQIAIVESMIKDATNSELINLEKKKEILLSIGDIPKEKRAEFRGLLDRRIRDANRLATILDGVEGEESSKRLGILEMPVEELNLSAHSFNCLKRAGIDKVIDLVGKSEEEVKKIRNLGRSSYNEVIEELQSLGIEMVDDHLDFEGEKSFEKLEILDVPIEELNLSAHSFNCLKRAWIDKVMDLVGRSEEEVKKIRYLGRSSYDEVIEELQSLGIEMVDGHLNFVSTNLLKNNGVPGEDEKETLVKHILEQQDTIGEQQAEINELSSQNKEEVNE